MRRGPVIVAGGVALVTVAAVFGVRSVLRPAPDVEDFVGAGSGAVIVEIVPGQSAGEIGETLRRAGVVASTQSFVQVVVARSKEGSLQPGRYRMRRGMAAASALDLLLAPTSRVMRTVTVPEGLRLSEVLATLSAKSDIPLKDFTKAVARPDGLRLPAYARGVVEGFLFPATYEITPGTTAQGLLAAMVDRFRQAARDVRLERLAPRHNLTPLQAVTLASIVQAEGGRVSDYPKIAQVVYNRLRRGAKLEMDSTVNYALRRHTLKVSVQDTKVDSPYNTYARPGLPPAPIGNPGESALRAALQPAKGDWYWFVTTDPRRKITKFTDKETEFRKYREELNRYLGAN
ncbi:endolytic transglycosylase MltG [Sphaerimonospora cavernae]|uniref:Endolytic murein transglycosylase n=1 Tax=Sphaerimonospora cavernae TaxID=1740611 RepID=A0ABV6U7F1_9ACTN